MSTWPEARAAKSNRHEREHRRYYRLRSMLGPRCRWCGEKVPKAIGVTEHATCGPEFATLSTLAGDVD